MKFYQYGRSMVEMLGVLAIIGVLSVGSISGYNKAMMKYKLNKSIDQLNMAFNATYRHLADFTYQSSYGGALMDILPYLIKLGEIPDDVTLDDKSISALGHIRVYDSLDNTISVYMDVSGQTQVTLEIQQTKQEKALAREMCRNVMRIAQSFYDSINLVRLLIGNGTLYYTGAWNNAPSYTKLKDVDVMQVCSEAKKFLIYVHFYNGQ